MRESEAANRTAGRTDAREVPSRRSAFVMSAGRWGSIFWPKSKHSSRENAPRIQFEPATYVQCCSFSRFLHRLPRPAPGRASTRTRQLTTGD